VGEVKEPSPDFVVALAALRDGLAELGAPFAFIGGVAVIAAGVTRYTADIDATVSGAATKLEGVLPTLGRFGIVPRVPDALAFARERQVFLLKHAPTGVDLDVSLAWLPFEEEAIARSEDKDFGGERIRAARPENLVVYKMVAGRAQDMADVSSLLLLYGSRLDIGRIRRLVREFAEALESPEISELFENELRKASLADPAH
jgi:hypothetical protein